MKSSLTLALFSSLFLAASCGNGGENPPEGIQWGPNGASTAGPNGQQRETTTPIQSLYMAKFTTVNEAMVGTIPGSATIRRHNDDLFAYVRLFSGSPNAWHPQYVMTGSRCPTPEDDANMDGVLDMQEARAVWGDILIPLDYSLKSQEAGKNIFPVGDGAGSYYYEKKTSYIDLENDLLSEDTNFNDLMVKLKYGEKLAFDGKVVVVLGVDEFASFPNTVANFDGLATFKTIPIACGIFEKVTQVPGATVDENSGIPGPVAPPTPGVGEPAPDNNPLPGDGPSRRPGYSPSDDDTIIDWWLERWRRWRSNRRDRMSDSDRRRDWDW